MPWLYSTCKKWKPAVKASVDVADPVKLIEPTTAPSTSTDATASAVSSRLHVDCGSGRKNQADARRATLPLKVHTLDADDRAREFKLANSSGGPSTE